jgi:propanol-preferring alcohol dehydrogenase
MSEPTFDIPKIQKAAVVAKTGNTVQVRNDLPVKSPADLAPGECLVKLHCTGVCHTDLHAALGDCPVKLGQRVGIKWIADSYVSTHSFSILQIDNPFRCLNCEQCKKGHEQSESISDVREYPLQEYLFSYQIDCYNVKLSGYTVDGTFSQYVVRFCCYNVFSFVITFPPGILRQFRYAHT